MALIASLAALCAAVALAFLETAFGHRLLRALGPQMECGTTYLLCASASGFVVCEATLALADFFVPLRIALSIIVVAAVAYGASEFQPVLRAISGILRRIAEAPLTERCLAGLAALVLFFEGLASTAPLTGSDALHYHFAAPLHLLRSGSRPDFFLTHSFLIGQGHLLILTGLALGSEKLALALVWLGSILAAAAGVCLARKWVSRQWAWVTALAFLLNPVVFWQGTTSGAPDLWMTFFATVAVLAIAEVSARPSVQLTLLCGALAGATAGAKYTGCFIAVALLVAFFIEARAASSIGLFITASLLAGAWPYLRNLIWTGDPVFPFGLRWFAPERINSVALDALRADTGLSGHRGLAQLIRFPFFAAIDHERLGFWQFFGPLVLILAPLFLLWVRRSTAWRVTLVVWLLGSLAIGGVSGGLRFLLPLFPLALVAAITVTADLDTRQWRLAWVLSLVSIFGFLLFGLGGLAIYTRSAIAASIGVVDHETYLQQRSPDYAISAFVNRALAGREGEGNALVFFRHIYYLRVPFLNGDPQYSWAVDPTRLATPEAWNYFLLSNHIRWVVRAPDYPAEIAAPLAHLERSGVLVPFAREDVSTFEGMRIFGVRRTFTAMILGVNK